MLPELPLSALLPPELLLLEPLDVGEDAPDRLDALATAGALFVEDRGDEPPPTAPTPAPPPAEKPGPPPYEALRLRPQVRFALKPPPER